MRIKSFGGLSLCLGEEPVSGLASRKAEALLLYLACNPRPHPRELLADLLWDDRTQRQALSNLRVLLSSLRKQLGDYLDISRETVSVNPDATIWLDVAALEEGLSPAGEPGGIPSPRARAQVEAALALYRDEFLSGFFLREASRFEEWQVRERERLHHLALDGLQKLVDHALACGHYEAGTAHAHRLLALEPLSETAHRQLMQLLAFSGQREQALAQYETCGQLLRDELGIAPTPETQALYEEIRSGALGPPAPPPHNLPAQLTSFVGRRRELDQAAALLQDARLLTLTGPGGSGKTRLALQLAGEQLPSFPDGVFFVSLASLRDPRLVPQTIAAALDVKPAKGQRNLEALQEELANKETLLLLDNYEHLLEAATVASHLLTATERLRIVATSREPLQLRGEQRYPVPPLQLPGENGHSGDEIAAVEAVWLFCLRAQAADPAFELTGDNLPAVVAICRRLDGLPLALELAAARLSAYTPQMLLQRLSTRLGTLTRGLRDLPRRQQTLRDTIAWSFDLLDEGEQLLFSRLGVFAGRWTLSDAEAVCGPGLPLDVADGLASLAGKNLVVAAEGPAGEPCYDMLATIGEFATEQLESSSEQPAIHERLAHYMAEHLPAAVPADPKGADAPAWFSFLDLELDNVRSALAYFLDHGEAQPALQIIELVYDAWTDQLVEEGSAWLDGLLALLGDEPTAARGRALFLQGGLLLGGFDNRRAAELAQQSVHCYRACGDQRGLFWALSVLGQAHLALGNFVRMGHYFDEAISIAEELGDTSLLCTALLLSTLGSTDFRTSREKAQRCLELATAEGWIGRASTYKTWAADCELRLGNYDTAVTLLRECEAAERQMGRERQLAQLLISLGEAELRRGQLEEADRALSEGLELASEFADVDFPPYFYERFAPLAATRGDFERAARLFGAAEAARELPGGCALNPELRPAYEQDVAAVRAGLTEEAFTAAWQRGRTMSLEEAMAYALGR